MFYHFISLSVTACKQEMTPVKIRQAVTKDLTSSSKFSGSSVLTLQTHLDVQTFPWLILDGYRLKMKQKQICK